MISEKKIKKYLLSKETEVRVYDLLDSTNAEAKRYAATAADRHPVLFLAREQSAGRGRLGRSFLSRAGRGIYLSLLYFTDKALSSAVSVTTAAAAVTACAVERVTGERMRIKWVNDIYNGRGKVCGILVETMPVDGAVAVIVGIGINLGEDDFPEELKGIASSVNVPDGREDEIVAEVCDRLLAHGENPSDRRYMEAYRARFMLGGASVDLFRAGELAGRGTVVGVDDDGGLILLPDGEEKAIRVFSGEVTVRLSPK